MKYILTEKINKKYVLREDNENPLASLLQAIQEDAVSQATAVQGNATNQDNNQGSTENGQNIDWDARYAEYKNKGSVGLETFWNLFYKTFANPTYVEGLGEAFRQECTAKGFTEKTNPFITFVNLVIAEQSGLTMQMVTPNYYNNIHNSYLANSITDDTLKNESDFNLLWYPALYNTANDFTAYLKQEQRLKNNNWPGLSSDGAWESKNPDCIKALIFNIFSSTVAIGSQIKLSDDNKTITDFPKYEEIDSTAKNAITALKPLTILKVLIDLITQKTFKQKDSVEIDKIKSKFNTAEIQAAAIIIAWSLLEDDAEKALSNEINKNLGIKISDIIADLQKSIKAENLRAAGKALNSLDLDEADALTTLLKGLIQLRFPKQTQS